MIPFASERDETGSARSAPVDTYTEILRLTNAGYTTSTWCNYGGVDDEEDNNKRTRKGQQSQ
jgi:hypothetical protein